MDPERRPPLTAGRPLGVVIPTLNEARRLPSLLDDLGEVGVPHEIVVVDGGSSDGTPALARNRGCRIERSERGRGIQLNAGARALSTPWLLFLHADVRLPDVTRRAVARWIEGGSTEQAASFRFRLDGNRWLYRVTEAGQRIRERITGIPYGDQGLLLHRSLFDAVGGYPDLPIMEDVEMGRRLRSRKALERLPFPVVSSPRRYERAGVVRSWIRNGALSLLHRFGVPPATLARWYGGGTEDGHTRYVPPATCTLLVFAKAPKEGQVKTRLARTVGDRRATELYRTVGSRIMSQVVDGRFRIAVCYDPPDAEEEIAGWIGSEGVGSEGIELRPQCSGDLGRRMAEAFRWAFQSSDRVCVIGTDTPDVSSRVVEDAFQALDRVDLVVGPSTDGGYYLMALARPQDALFEEVDWGTERVLDATLARAHEMGLRCLLLEPRTDLDTEEDLERLGLDGGSP